MIIGDGFNTFGLSRQSDNMVPQTLELSEAYPNPFNPVTSFTYSVPVDGNVQLFIYDVNGRVVAELVNSWQSAGTYPVVWDAKELSSGVYVVEIVANDNAVAKKMMLIK